MAVQLLKKNVNTNQVASNQEGLARAIHNLKIKHRAENH